MLFTHWLKDYIENSNLPPTRTLHKLLCSQWARHTTCRQTFTYYELISECCQSNCQQISDPRGVSYRGLLGILVKSYYFIASDNCPHDDGWVVAFIANTAASKLDGLRHLSAQLNTELLVARMKNETFLPVFEDMLSRCRDKDHTVRGIVFASFGLLKRLHWAIVQNRKATLVDTIIEFVLTSCDDSLGGVRAVVYKALGDMINAGVG